MQAGAQGRRIADRPRRVARRFGRRAGAAPTGGATDRARRGRASAACRSTGSAGPGGRSRPARPRTGSPARPRRWPSIRAAGAGRGAAVRHPRRSRASIGSNPMRLPRWASRCAGGSQRSRLAASRSRNLTGELAAARATYVDAGANLSGQRRAAAARLDAAVAAELAPLKLDAARFRTAHRRRRTGPVGHRPRRIRGLDQPRGAFGALTRIASGGELSRFILALKVALAEAGSAATMIFDEVDRGVGGAVASAVGERLARLARAIQVLVVTHSPQVAARASHHYRIEKSHGPDGTPHERPQALRRRAPRGDRADALGRFDHRGSAGAGVAPARRRVTAYVALLRGVNLVGKSTLKMADLEDIADGLGIAAARTYIASGNLLFLERRTRSVREAKARTGATRLISAGTCWVMSFAARRR